VEAGLIRGAGIARLMNNETREIVIGAAAFGCLMLVLAYLYGGRDWREAKSGGGSHVLITAKFNKVDGLVEGDSVTMSGIQIGTIAAMTLDDRYRAVVTMKVSGAVPLPTDTSAAIHTDGLFGNKFIVLEPGGDEKRLKPGGEITYTQDSVVVGDLLDLIISEGRAALKSRQDADPKAAKK
jgi:phospholipid/cholesterol/gamma-HCH transport system substrate-binding protein